MRDDEPPPWTREAAYARFLRLKATLPNTFRPDPLFVESNSNDAWIIGDAVLRVCWRGDRARFLREAQFVAAHLPSILRPGVIGFGNYEDFTWTLHERNAGESRACAAAPAGPSAARLSPGSAGHARGSVRY